MSSPLPPARKQEGRGARGAGEATSGGPTLPAPTSLLEPPLRDVSPFPQSVLSILELSCEQLRSSSGPLDYLSSVSPPECPLADRGP